MKIGILCEGRLGGEDAQVLTYLANRIAPQASIQAFPQGNKKDLFTNAGKVVKSLFTQGYGKVLIVWDILPRWERPDGEQQDLQDLEPSLLAEGVSQKPCLFKIAIHKELEAWLLADGSALSAALQPKKKISNTNRADTVGNPKKRLGKIIAQNNAFMGPHASQGNYQPKLMALRIAENIPRNFGALDKIDAFKKFGLSLTKPC